MLETDRDARIDAMVGPSKHRPIIWWGHYGHSRRQRGDTEPRTGLGLRGEEAAMGEAEQVNKTKQSRCRNYVRRSAVSN